MHLRAKLQGTSRVVCRHSFLPVNRTLSGAWLHYKTRRAQLARSSPETEQEKSPADAPQEWETPVPSKRPDIFPEFEKMDRVFLPKPLPGDPEIPDEEEDEMKKRTFPGDPDPEQKPGEPSEPEPSEPGQDPEKDTNMPQIPD